MHRKTNFRTLLFALTYVSCIITAFCNDESTKTERSNRIDTSSPSSKLSNKSVDVSGDHSSATTASTSSHVVLEGGSAIPIKVDNINDTTTSRKSIQNDALNKKILQLDSYQDVKNDTSDKKPHKGRKGVDLFEGINLEDLSSEHTLNDGVKVNLDKNKLKSGNNMTTPGSSNINSSVKLMINSSTDSSDHSESSAQEHSSHDSNSMPSNSKTTEPLSSTVVEKVNIVEVVISPKPKPEVTRIDDLDDHSSFSFASAGSDYVIPIVATIFAAPLLIVLAMFLYKRSKEFWERRHYRRMDFLIDGMYND